MQEGPKLTTKKSAKSDVDNCELLNEFQTSLRHSSKCLVPESLQSYHIANN